MPESLPRYKQSFMKFVDKKFIYINEQFALGLLSYPFFSRQYQQQAFLYHHEEH